MADKFVFGGQTLASVTCGTCGVTHAIPAQRYDTCLEEGGYWHCPNGHSWGFRKGKQALLATERERDRLKQENARLAEEAEAAERKSLRVAAELKRHKKRAAAGTCPCCQRTFDNMARHMKSKHPNYNVIPLQAA